MQRAMWPLVATVVGANAALIAITTTIATPSLLEPTWFFGPEFGYVVLGLCTMLFFLTLLALAASSRSVAHRPVAGLLGASSGGLAFAMSEGSWRPIAAVLALASLAVAVLAMALGRAHDADDAGPEAEAAATPPGPRP